MRVDIVTIFPSIFDSYLGASLMKRARKSGILDVRVCDLRDFSENRHRKVDDKPFGGGPGMVLALPAVHRAVRAIESKSKKTKRRIILFSTRGAPLTEHTARRLAAFEQLILICGRYEGVDERVAKFVADEEISIGNYVLSGGELPALVLTEAVARHLKGFLGKEESLEGIHGSFPTYTRPAAFLIKRPGSKTRRAAVPPVLLSGNHEKIRAWRKRHGTGGGKCAR